MPMHPNPMAETSSPSPSVRLSTGFLLTAHRSVVGYLRQHYDNAVNASVNNATRASSCTSADDDTSSSEPSIARAASPALLSMSSAILASIVWAAMMRHAVTGSPWPM